VVLLAEGGVLGSSLRGTQVPWASLAEWRAVVEGADAAVPVAIGTRQALAREVLLAESPAVAAVLVSWSEEGLAPLRGIGRGVALIALLGAALAAIAVLWITRRTGSG
jgi:hypothetical protein